MKYLEKKFSIGGYKPKMACEKCVFKSGPHASWCLNSDEVVVWDEPDENGENDRVFCTIKQAIKEATLFASYSGFEYDDDIEALQDFMTTHWAWREKRLSENNKSADELLNEPSTF